MKQRISKLHLNSESLFWLSEDFVINYSFGSNINIPFSYSKYDLWLDGMAGQNIMILIDHEGHVNINMKMIKKPYKIEPSIINLL